MLSDIFPPDKLESIVAVAVDTFSLALASDEVVECSAFVEVEAGIAIL